MATPNLHAFDLRRWLANPRRRRQRRLHLIETLSLGEKRFVGLLSIDGREVLVGATLHSLTLLTELGDRDFEDALSQAAAPPAGEIQ